MKQTDETQLNADDLPQEESSEDIQTEAEQTPRPETVTPKGRKWLSYVICASALAVVTLLCAWALGGYTETDVKQLVGNWSSSFFVSGVLCLGVGLLIWCGNEGAFDMLGYGVKSLFRLFRKDVKDRKYGGYYEYAQARKERKKPFLYLVIVGGAYLLVGIVLFVVYWYLPAP